MATSELCIFRRSSFDCAFFTIAEEELSIKKSKMLPIFLSAVTLLSSQNIFFMSANAAETEHEPSETAVYAVASGSVYTIDQGFKFEIFDNYASIVDFYEEEYSISDPEYGATHVLKVPGTVAYDDHDYNVEVISMHFNTDSSFTKIIIPKTVKRLSARTFKDKRNLEYVQFEKNSELNEMEYSSGGCFEGTTLLSQTTSVTSTAMVRSPQVTRLSFCA